MSAPYVKDVAVSCIAAAIVSAVGAGLTMYATQQAVGVRLSRAEQDIHASQIVIETNRLAQETDLKSLRSELSIIGSDVSYIRGVLESRGGS